MKNTNSFAKGKSAWKSTLKTSGQKLLAKSSQMKKEPEKGESKKHEKSESKSKEKSEDKLTKSGAKKSGAKSIIKSKITQDQQKGGYMKGKKVKAPTPFNLVKNLGKAMARMK